jgi:hypothetical protein
MCFSEVGGRFVDNILYCDYSNVIVTVRLVTFERN